MWKRVILGAAVSLSSPSCGLWNYTKSDQYGVQPLLASEPGKQIDLVALIDPTGSRQGSHLTDDQKLALAYSNFYGGGSEAELRRKRNGVQEHILMISDQAAAEFVKLIKKHDSTANFSLGTITTTLAGLGAVFTPASTVRAMSGSAAIFSGVRAEWNEVLFNNLTIQLVVRGMETRRKRMYEDIRTRRKNASLAQYTIQEAVKDAIAYHGAFNLVAGLEESGLALQRVNDPGLKELERVLSKSKLLKSSLNLTAFAGASNEASSIIASLKANQTLLVSEANAADELAKKARETLDAFSQLSEAPAVLDGEATNNAFNPARAKVTASLTKVQERIAAVRAKAKEVAEADPSVASLISAIGAASLSIDHGTDDETSRSKNELETNLARARIKLVDLEQAIRGVDAESEDGSVENATKELQASVQQAYATAAEQLASLRDSLFKTQIASLDEHYRALKTLKLDSPDLLTTKAAARRTSDEVERKLSRVESVLAAVAPGAPQLGQLTRPVRESLRILQQQIRATQLKTPTSH